MSDVPATGVLLAAGHGRRAGGPKALIPVEGAPLWQVRAQQLQQAGLARVVAVVHPAALPASLVSGGISAAGKFLGSMFTRAGVSFSPLAPHRNSITPREPPLARGPSGQPNIHPAGVDNCPPP